MAIERFNMVLPVKFEGLSDLANPEQRSFAEELERRLVVTQDAMLRALREQVVVEKSILPAMQNGGVTETTLILATTADDEDAKVFSIMWGEG